MTITHTHPELTGIELVILARASDTPRPTARQLIQAAVRLRPPADTAARAGRAGRGALSRLRQRAWLAEAPDKRWSLTAQGAEVLRRVFEVATVPAWPTMRDRYMPALGLGLKPMSREAGRALATKRTIVARVVTATSERPAAVTELCDSLLVQALGLPGRPTSIFEVRAHLLARHLGLPAKRLPRTERAFQTFIEHAAAAELQLRRVTARDGLCALSRRWLYRQPIGAPMLIEAVHDALTRIGPAGRFGGEKVFISALWHEVVRHRGMTDLSLGDFKRWLVDANRDQLVDLVRADLVGAMDPQLVAESEIEDLGATFHFVIDRRARDSHRRGEA